MNRQTAYQLAQRILDREACRTFEELASCVGSTAEAREHSAGSDFLVSVHYVWSEPGRCIEIQVWVDSASPQRFERLEERVLVYAPAAA